MELIENNEKKIPSLYPEEYVTFRRQTKNLSVKENATYRTQTKSFPSVCTKENVAHGRKIKKISAVGMN
jgi:hypothetical protein